MADTANRASIPGVRVGQMWTSEDKVGVRETFVFEPFRPVPD